MGVSALKCSHGHVRNNILYNAEFPYTAEYNAENNAENNAEYRQLSRVRNNVNELFLPIYIFGAIYIAIYRLLPQSL